MKKWREAEVMKETSTRCSTVCVTGIELQSRFLSPYPRFRNGFTMNPATVRFIFSFGVSKVTIFFYEVESFTLAGEEGFSGDALGEGGKERFKKLLLFSGNDYLGLSSHPTIANAAASVCFQNSFISTN